jgi:FixJ family two-component response regulator
MSGPTDSRLALIAIVDDDASVRKATCSLLRSRGYAVRTFASAEEFLQSADLKGTECVISDICMPVTDGIELQAILRAQGRTVPFIFMTAHPEGVIRMRAMNGGAMGYLTKPFDAPTLIKYVETALETPQEPAPSA